MKKDLIFGSLIHLEQAKRFTMKVNDYLAFASYVKEDGKLFLTHAEVPYQLRGQGVGEKLVLEVFEYLKENRLSATAICPFIKKVRNEHSEWTSIIG